MAPGSAEIIHSVGDAPSRFNESTNDKSRKSLLQAINERLEQLEDGSGRERYSAAKNLGELGQRINGNVGARILSALRLVGDRDPDPYVRIVAEEAIEKIQSKAHDSGAAAR